MKNLYPLLFLILACTFSSSAQFYQIDLGAVEQRTCEFDSTMTIDAYSKIRMYSTLNDEWDGLPDSSLCYSLVQIGNSWRFPTSDIPSNRSAFFEMELDSTLLLDTSTVYLISQLFGYICFSSACSSVHVSLQMPDSSGNETISSDTEVFFDSDYGFPVCFPTQKVLQQRIDHVIYEFRRVGESPSLIFSNPTIEEHWYGTQIIPQTTLEYVDGQGAQLTGPTLIRYWHEVYPSADSISYTDVVPYGDPADSTVAQLYVSFGGSLYFQNYTALRGALVNGSDSVRHGLEIILNGNMCLYFVEVSWFGGNSLVIDGGSIDIEDAMSCTLFGKGGTLRIKSGSEFNYGHHGIGMMVLKTGARIEIEPGAELTLNGPVHIYENYTDPGPQQLYMDLVAGAKLTFGEGSSLSNQYSFDGTMKLNIHMLGGELDLSGLTEEDAKLINLIYDEPSVRPWKNLSLYPNPVSATLQFIWVAEGAGTDLGYEIFDMSGKLVADGQVTTGSPGHNRFLLDASALVSGIYVLRLTGDGDVLARRKFVKD